ncbi:MAG: TonB family protein [Thermoanaerobaculia bacterium]
MMDKKPCVRCERGIDAAAQRCPFCNWDQSRPAPATPPPVPAAVAEYKPPEEWNVRKLLLMGGVGVLALVVAFLIGMVINSDDAPKTAPDTVEEQIAQDQARAKAPVRRADTPLVPMNEPGGIEQPITSAPVAAQPGATNDYQRTDATAVSATEYAEMAKRARAEKDRMAALVDPRSITGPAYAQATRNPYPRRTAPAPSGDTPQSVTNAPVVQRRGVMRTRPIPQYQPLPQISARGTARLSLLIGTDGRVKRIDIERGLQGNTSALIDAVQSWRFKPATENGEPIAAPYSVEISFTR